MCWSEPPQWVLARVGGLVEALNHAIGLVEQKAAFIVVACIFGLRHQVTQASHALRDVHHVLFLLSARMIMETVLDRSEVE